SSADDERCKEAVKRRSFTKPPIDSRFEPKPFADVVRRGQRQDGRRHQRGINQSYGKKKPCEFARKRNQRSRCFGYVGQVAAAAFVNGSRARHYDKEGD